MTDPRSENSGFILSVKRSRSSPESAPTPTKKLLCVGQGNSKMSSPALSLEDFEASVKNIVSQLLDDKLSHLSTKEDVRSLKEEICGLKLENERLSLEVNKLKSFKLDFDEKLESLEIKQREKNLIFKGIPSAGSSSALESVLEFCKDTLKVEIEGSKLNAFKIGSPKLVTRPIMVHFQDYQDKVRVTKSLITLKNTGFVVHGDYPLTTRKKRSKLRLVQQELMRRGSNNSIKLGFNALFVDNIKFMWNMSLGLVCEGVCGSRKIGELTGLDVSEFLQSLLIDDSMVPALGVGPSGVAPSATRPPLLPS